MITTKKVTIPNSTNIEVAAKHPPPALHQRVVAVVSPFILFSFSFWRITPAPKNPIPVTTWLSTLDTSA